MNKKKIIAGLVSAVTAFSALGVISANANIREIKHPYFGDVIRYDLTMDQVRIVYKGNRPSETYRRGDVNGDGQINVTDTVRIAAAIRGKTRLNPKELCRADINGDKNIDDKDLGILSLKLRNISNFSTPKSYSIDTANVYLTIYD